MKPLSHTQRQKVTDRPTTVNTGNLISRLRRIRYELAQMLTQVDEALARIETEGKA